MESKKIHILSACDDFFSQHLGVTLVSLLENTSNPKHIVYHIVDINISTKNKQYFKEIADRYSCQLNFIEVNDNIFANFPVSKQFPIAIYYRLLSHRIVDENINKLIYLDSDIVVKNDIKDLWNIDLTDYCLAAVADNLGYRRLLDLGLPEGTLYFNSGVLVMNLNKWREKSIGESVIKYIDDNKDKLKWVDQDALNAVLYNKWIQLHPTWNVQLNMFYFRDYEQVFNSESVLEAKKSPSIIHYTSNSKPWHDDNIHPMKQEYYKYLSLTPWSKFKPTKAKFVKRCKNKMIWKIKTSTPDLIYLCIRKLMNRTNINFKYRD